MSTSATRILVFLPTFDFYVLDSKELVQQIEEKLGYPTEVFKCNAMRRRIQNGYLEETKSKTLIGCTKHVIEEFKQKYPNLAVSLSDYNWGSFVEPNVTIGEVHHLHISNFPASLDAQDRKEYLNNRLLSILSPEDYTIEFSTKSRQTGTLQSFVKITFKPYVPVKTRFYAKVLLNHEEVKRIPSSFVLILASNEQIRETEFTSIQRNVEELFSSIPLPPSKYKVSRIEGSQTLFRISFASSVPENVRRVAKRLLKEQELYLFRNDEKSGTEHYITAIWFNTNRSPDRVLNTNVNMNATGSSSFTHTHLSNYQPLSQPLNIPARVKERRMISLARGNN